MSVYVGLPQLVADYFGLFGGVSVYFGTVSCISGQGYEGASLELYTGVFNTSDYVNTWIF